MTREKMLDPSSPAANDSDGPRDADHQPTPTPATAKSPSPGTAVVTLDTPLRRGESEIAAVTLRKPTVGALRGVKLADLVQMDTDALTRVLPRISDLTDAEIKRLDPADLLQIATEVAGFLLPRSALEAAS